MTGPVGKRELCFPKISIIYSKTKQNKILTNSLRFQRQNHATSDHVQQRSTFPGNSELFPV